MLNTFRRLFLWRPAEVLLRRMVKGQLPNSLVARIIPPEYLHAPGSWRDVETHGLLQRLDLSNVIDHSAYFGLRDPGDEHLMALIRPDHLVVDIGANIGLRTMAFAHAVPQGKVISFEPHPDTFDRLVDHVQRNDLSNVHLVNKGIGRAESTERLFEVVGNNPGMNRILRDPEAAGAHAFTAIQLTTLEHELAERSIGKVDVIKVDVEGFEMEVLCGILPVIHRDRPILFVELDDDNLRDNGSSAQELVDLLITNGYRALHADSLTELPQDLSHCHYDILCTPYRPV